ncbi:MAG: hypothetical protein JO147_06240 [Actinobacteria bacterium]|nr:hypothetical protein [Actinomycetota bacterium]
MTRTSVDRHVDSPTVALPTADTDTEESFERWAMDGSTRSDLVRFLLDRFDEDDAALRQISRKSLDAVGTDKMSRLRAEAAARRQLVGAMQRVVVLRDRDADVGARDVAVQALCLLAVAYHDHGDFRSHWRPPRR